MGQQNDEKENFDHVITPKHVTDVFYNTINQCYDDMFQVQYLSKYNQQASIFRNDTSATGRDRNNPDDASNKNSKNIFDFKDPNIISRNETGNVKLVNQYSTRTDKPGLFNSKGKENEDAIYTTLSSEKIGLNRFLTSFSTNRTGVYEISK